MGEYDYGYPLKCKLCTDLFRNCPALTAKPYLIENGNARLMLIGLFIFPFRALAPTIAGAIYDATGAYTMAFVILLAFNLIGFICAFLTLPPKKPEPDRKPITYPA